MVAKYLTTRPILNLCIEEEWRPGAWVSKRWWYQSGIDPAGARDAEMEAEREEAGT